MRIALGIEYNGHAYHGWQSQTGLSTVQASVENAIAKIANESVKLFCAGRTDAGVHATGQVVHFDTNAKRHIDAWVYGANSHLPSSIVVRWAKHVDYSFHARFTAVSRRYRYVISNTPIRPAILTSRVCWYYYPLDVARMREAGQYLIGEQDFTSFRSSQCNAKTPTRNVTEFTIQRHGNFVIFDVEANAFLHHMVRNIAGSLMKIGSGNKEPEWMQEVLGSKNRRVAAETSSPDGLYLIRVNYPEPYIFPLSDPVFLI